MGRLSKMLILILFVAIFPFQGLFPILGETLGSTNGYWEMIGKEVIWLEPFLAEKWTYPQDIPWDKTYSAVVNGGEVTTVYTGGEFDVTRTDYCKYWSVPNPSINFKWSAPPDIIKPGENYSFNYEASGNGSNGLIISSLVSYSGAPSGWCPLSEKNGGQQSWSFKPPEPPKAGVADKRYIQVELSSGSVGTGCLNMMGYNYVYEWVSTKPEIKSITVVPGNISLTSSSPVQLKVNAQMVDGTIKDITKDPDTDYDVDDPDVITVSDTGLLKVTSGAKNGESAVITVSSGEIEKTCTVRLAIVAIKSLKSSTSSVVLSNTAGKNSKQLKITATLPNNTTSVVTAKAAYTSSNSNYFTISAGGLLKVLPSAPKGAKGSITASYGGKTCKIGISVK